MDDRIDNIIAADDSGFEEERLFQELPEKLLKDVDVPKNPDGARDESSWRENPYRS